MALWKRLLWIAVTILGLASICVLALSRGEPVSPLWLVTAGFCAAAISYRFYSKWLAAKALVLTDERAPPAVCADYVTAVVSRKRGVGIGHYFPGESRS